MSYDPYDQESTQLDTKNTLSTSRTPSLPKGHTISAFVPEKPDTFRPFVAKFRAMIPPQYAAALDIGGDMPSFPSVCAANPEMSTEEARALYDQVQDDFKTASAYIYKQLIVMIDFSGSAVGVPLFNTLDRKYDNDGVGALVHLARRFDNYGTFDKQAKLYALLNHEKLVEQIALLNSPDEATDYLGTLYGSVWLHISHNDASFPLDYVRRVLMAMREVKGEVAQIAFQCLARVQPVIMSQFDQKGVPLSMSAAHPLSASLEPVYKDADLFIEMVTAMWPTRKGRAMPIRRVPADPAAPPSTADDVWEGCNFCNCRGTSAVLAVENAIAADDASFVQDAPVAAESIDDFPPGFGDDYVKSYNYDYDESADYELIGRVSPMAEVMGAAEEPDGNVLLASFHDNNGEQLPKLGQAEHPSGLRLVLRGHLGTVGTCGWRRRSLLPSQRGPQIRRK